MGVEIKVPTLGESVTQATVAKWFKKAVDAGALDEPLVEIETDKVTVEVNAPAAGALASIAAPEGSDVQVGALLGVIEAGAAGTKSAPAKAPAKVEAPKTAPAPAPKAAPAPIPSPTPAAEVSSALAPAVRKLVEEHRLDAATIPATGPGGRLTKADVIAFVERGLARVTPRASAPAAAAPARPEDPREERVRMTRLRRLIAERLKESQNTAVMLTTYNEVDMKAAMDMRNQFKDAFEKKHGTRLGFMSFFVRACCAALKEWPAVNAEIHGEHLSHDIGVDNVTPCVNVA